MPIVLDESMKVQRPPTCESDVRVYHLHPVTPLYRTGTFKLTLKAKTIAFGGARRFQL